MARDGCRHVGKRPLSRGALIALTIAFEFAVGILVDKKTLGQLAAAYAFWRGETWPFVLLILGLTPLFWRGKV